jgi:hypothetical protein
MTTSPPDDAPRHAASSVESSVESSTSDLAELKARVAASNRSLGRVLSIIGATLAAIALLLVIGGGIALTLLDAARQSGASRTSTQSTAALIVAVMSLPPGLLGLFAMCGLIMGEQMRRGAITKNPDAPDTLLPSASMVSRFSVLSYGWHSFWVVVGLVISFVLVGLPVISWFTGGWPENVRESAAFSGFWVIYGSIAFGITVATATSLLKKHLFLRAVAAGRATAAGGPGKAFWRWLDYRWRLDLWLAGIGGLGVVLSFTFLSGYVGPDSYAARRAAAFVPFAVMFAAGVLLIVLGAIAAAQFWRAGELLGSGESVD